MVFKKIGAGILCIGLGAAVTGLPVSSYTTNELRYIVEQATPQKSTIIIAGYLEGNEKKMMTFPVSPDTPLGKIEKGDVLVATYSQMQSPLGIGLDAVLKRKGYLSCCTNLEYRIEKKQ